MTAPFRHEAVFYDDLPGFLAGTVPFLLEGIADAEPALVAVDPEKAEAMRTELPGGNAAVRFVDVTDLGRNPGRLISAWADFLGEHPAARPMRGIGEPVWFGRTPEEIAECQRHEALLNLAFADRRDFVLICPYDSTQLDRSVLAEARSSHPLLVQNGETTASKQYDGDVAPYAGSLAEPTGPVESWNLTEHSLAELRRWVSFAASAAGLEPEHIEDLTLAVSEAATNTLQHAGGDGELRLWRHEGCIVCEVHDHGRMLDPLAGRLPVPLDEPSGRGLWLIHQLCDLVQIRSSEAGNVVRMHMRTSNKPAAQGVV